MATLIIFDDGCERGGEGVGGGRQSGALVIRDHDVATPARGYFLPFVGYLWHKGAYNRSFQCMEATDHAIITQRGVLLWHRPWRQHSKVQPIRGEYLEDLDQ